MIHESHIWIFIQRMRNQYLKEIAGCSCSPKHESQQLSMETTWMSINGCMDEGDVIYTHDGILFSHKKRNPAIRENMNETGEIMLSEINQKQNDKHCMNSFIQGIYRSQTHRNRDQYGGCQGLELCVRKIGRCWSEYKLSVIE